MDQFIRRIVGFGVQAAEVDGPALCLMFNQAISGQGLPTRLSTDHDPLFRFHRWQANQSVPQVPWSHPFIERLIGTIRREYLDRLFFWTADDLERKLELFKNYYNAARVHQGLSGDTPGEKAGGPTPEAAGLENYRWQSHCHGLFELPMPA
jgi:transposase InsO family protein